MPPSRDKQDLDMATAIMVTHPVGKIGWDKVKLVTQAMGYNWSSKTLSTYWSERLGKHRSQALKLLENNPKVGNIYPELAAQVGAPAGRGRKRKNTIKAEASTATLPALSPKREGPLSVPAGTGRKIIIDTLKPSKENIPFRQQPQPQQAITAGPGTGSGASVALAPQQKTTPSTRERKPLPTSRPPLKGPAKAAELYQRVKDGKTHRLPSMMPPAKKRRTGSTSAVPGGFIDEEEIEMIDVEDNSIFDAGNRESLSGPFDPSPMNPYAV